MKSMFFGSRSFRLAMSLAFGLGFGNPAWSKPSIQSVNVSPNPLVAGLDFSIAVAASPDVISATATFDFHPGKSQSLELTLIHQGSNWTASGIVPGSLSEKSKADVKVTVFDAENHKDQDTVHINVDQPFISAVFTNGVLTVTGDNHDNTLIVSRDVMGTLLVNGGAVPIIGGVSTISNTTLIEMFGLDGNDTLTVDDGNGPMPPAHLFGGEGDDILTGSASDDMLDGGPGNDTLFGRGGNDILIGGPGNDILVGGQGSDQIFGGDGDDQIIWNPGDGSDIVEGGDGNNVLVFNGSNANEIMDLSANDERFRLFRDVGNVTMDCNGIQQVVVHALGGADQLTINELTGTQVTNVVVDLASQQGTGDGAADTVIVNGTQTNDTITVSGSVTNVDVVGLSATVTIVGAESNLDRLVINALAGDDMVDASAVQAGAIALTLNGGAGNDTLIGGAGNDILIGGPGSDIEFGGPGDDVFIWNPGDGSDVIEGQAGQDTMLFNGANVAEKVDISANGQRVRFFRDVANITMDCNQIETIQFNALGGADTITVNDLTGTGVAAVNLDLANPAGSGLGDGAADSVIINATTNNDSVTVTGTSDVVTVTGLAANVNIAGTDPALDQLIINLLDGDDVLEASNLPAGLINLTVDGGPGNDVLIGSQGADVLLGGEGDDVLIGNGGQDILDGGPGNNTLIQ